MSSYYDLDRECLSKLGDVIPVTEHPKRTDFFDTIVNNANLQRRMPDGRIVVRIAGNDIKKVADLEREAGFTCLWASVEE